MAHNRWVTKHENGVSNVVDIAKARLRRIVNSIDLEELKESVKSLKEWEFMGKSQDLGLKYNFVFLDYPINFARTSFFNYVYQNF